MDHLVIIVIITNLPHRLVIDPIIIVHILNKIDENEKLVVVQHHPLHLVHHHLLPHHQILVQHQDLILHLPHHLQDQVIHPPIVRIENRPSNLNNKMMMKLNVQV